MCGGTAQTTQAVQIPPEVMQNYRAVNARATDVAATPFQQYSSDPNAFVAPLNQTQQAGIQNISNAGGISQPYFQGATSALMGGQAAATPYYGQATQDLMSGLQAGVTGTQAAYQPMAQGAQQARGLQGGALNQYQNALQSAQPYNEAATAGIMGGLAGSQPFNAAAAQGINQAQAGAQPYQGMATGLAAAGTQAVNAGPLGGQQINQYMSPYLNSVVGSTMANLRQQQGQEQSGLLGNQISQGAFGGDRGRIAQANLARQQDLATGQTVSGLMNQGYGQALGAAQQQQQLGLGASQANRAALQQGAGQMLGIGQQGYQQGIGAAQAQQGLGQQIFGQGLGAGQAMAGIGQQQYGQQAGIGQNFAQLGQQEFGQGAAQTAQQAALAQQQFGMGAGASQQMAGLGQGLYGMGAGTSQALAGLGTQAQQNALAAGQAQLGAGTVGQQTQQAGQTALYNQFLQQQGFPYQQAQFLANIAMGTGALSGSTTQTTQPMPFFSDERLKEGVEPIGKTFDGQKIVKFRYKNEPGTRIGLIAQDVEKHHPDAVGLAGGYKTVDYDAATKDAASKGHYARGGLAPESEGGAVLPFPMRRGFAEGGNPAQLIGNDEMAAILQAQFGMYGNQGIPGLGGSPGASGFVPAGTLPVGNLTVAGEAPKLPESQASQAIKAAGGLGDAYKSGKAAVKEIKSLFKEDETAAEPAAGSETSQEANTYLDENGKPTKPFYRGGLVNHYAAGGASSGPYGIPLSNSDTPDLMVAGDPPPVPKSGFTEMMDAAASIADTASSMSGKKKAAGGTAEKDVGSGTPYDAGSNPYMPDSAEGIEKKELAKPGAAPDAPESGFGQALHFAKDVGSIAALAAMMNRGGRTGYADGGAEEEGGGIFGSPAGDFDAEEARAKYLASFNRSAPPATEQLANDAPSVQSQGVAPPLPTFVKPTAPAVARLDIPEGFLRDRGAPPPLPEFVKPTAPAVVMPKIDIQDYVDRAQLEKSRNAPGLVPPLPKFVKPTAPAVVPGKFTISQDRETNGGVLNKFSDAYLRMGDAAETDMRDPKTSRIMKYAVAPAMWATTRGLSLIPASINAALSPEGTPFYPQRPVDAGKTYSFDAQGRSVGPAKRYIIGSNPEQESMRPPVTRPNAASPVKKPGITPGLGGGNAPAPAQAPVDTHAAEGALLARTGLGAPNIRQDLAQPTAQTAQGAGLQPQERKPGMLERALLPKGGYLDRLSQGDEDAVVPLLTGLGAMAGSSNRYGLGALAEGIGAGAAAYQPTKQAILERKSTQAQTGRVQQSTFANLQAMAPDGFQVVEGPGNTGQKTFTGPDGKTYHYELKAEMMQLPTRKNATPGAFNENALTTMDSDARRAMTNTVTPSDQAISSKINDSVVGTARNASADVQNQIAGIDTLVALPTTGFYAQGQNQPFFQKIGNTLSDIVSRFGLQKDIGSNVDYSNLKDPNVLTAIMQKVKSSAAFSQAAAADQTTIAGLENALHTALSSDNPKAANAYLSATMMVADRMALDEAKYAQNYRAQVDNAYPGIPNAYMAQSMDASFRSDPNFSQERYAKEKDALAKFISKFDPNVVRQMFSGQYNAEQIDKLFLQYEHVPNMSKYFTSAMK